MTTRRFFLQASLCSVAIPTVCTASGFESPLDCIAFVSSSHSRDTVSFLRSCRQGATAVDDFEPAGIDDFGAVRRLLGRSTSQIVIGLGRHSERTVIEQLASESGYRAIYGARHRSSGFGVQHEFTAPAAARDALGRALVESGAHWAAMLARQLPRLVVDTADMQRGVCHAVTAAPLSRGELLTSWALLRQAA